jgi:hypothetical protein
MATPLPGGSWPLALTTDATYLYMVETSDNANWSLYKIPRASPVTPGSATLIAPLVYNVTTKLNPGSMKVVGNTIYMTDVTLNANNVISLNLTGSPTLSVFASDTRVQGGIDASGGFLYTAGVYPGFGFGPILYKIPIANPAGSSYISLGDLGTTNVGGIAIIGDYAYILLTSVANYIVRVNLNTNAIDAQWLSLGTITNYQNAYSPIVANGNKLYFSYTTTTSSTAFVAEVNVDTTTITNTNYLPGVFASPANPYTQGLTNYDSQLYISFSNNSGGVPFIYGLLSGFVICFKEDSKILVLQDGVETYVPIQSLQKGNLVKTSRDGYKAIWAIGYSTLSNPGTDERIKDRLYRCSKENYPEVTEDLYITGCHSILVDELTDIQRKEIQDQFKKIYVTDQKYRLPACIDTRAVPYQEEGIFKIWHLALEHTDYFMNYGIYANGLLVETTSKRFLKELSKMTLLE